METRIPTFAIIWGREPKVLINQWVHIKALRAAGRGIKSIAKQIGC